MKKYQKHFTIGLIALGVILLVVSSFINTDKKITTSDSEDANTILANATKESKAVKETETKEFTNIDVNTYLEYYNGSEYKLVILARPTCQYCQIAEPILHNIAYEYNLEMYYLNTDDFSGEDQNNFIASNEEFSAGYGTPMLLVVGNGTIKNQVDGLTDRTHYIAFLQVNEFI